MASRTLRSSRLHRWVQRVSVYEYPDRAFRYDWPFGDATGSGDALPTLEAAQTAADERYQQTGHLCDWRCTSWVPEDV